MAILRDEDHSENYLVVHNSTVNSYESLSIEAMGSLIYWLAKPEGWQPSVSELAKTWGFGRDKAARIMRELKEAGYVKKSGARDHRGQFVTRELIVCETPRKDMDLEVMLPNNVVSMPENPTKAVNPSTVNPSTDEPSTVFTPTIKYKSLESTEKKESTEREGGKAKKRFTPPTRQEVEDYMLTKGADFEQAASWSEDFVEFYECKGWMVGKNKMQSWPMAASRWTKKNLTEGKGNGQRSNDQTTRSQRATMDAFSRL